MPPGLFRDGDVKSRKFPKIFYIIFVTIKSYDLSSCYSWEAFELLGCHNLSSLYPLFLLFSLLCVTDVFISPYMIDKSSKQPIRLALTRFC